MVKNFDHLAKLKYSPVNPTAFTERGLYMLATILKGRVATQTTINIINTFVEIRELSRAIARVPEVVDENEKKSLLKRSDLKQQNRPLRTGFGLIFLKKGLLKGARVP